MLREAVALTIPDLSAFARALRTTPRTEREPPGHLALLGHTARAAGFRNYQHMRATVAAQPVPPALRTTPEDPALDRRLQRAINVFDAAGRMRHWPGQTTLQGLCLWPLWARLPAERDLAERQVNDVLKDGHLFGDHVLLRRSLIDHRLVTRTPDGRVYRRIEQPPPPEALALIRAVARG